MKANDVGISKGYPLDFLDGEIRNHGVPPAMTTDKKEDSQLSKTTREYHLDS